MHTSQTNRLLGYPAEARLLIINADDFGMCHATNQAIMQTLQSGLVRSTTLMVPCPWALHAMHFLAAHPEVPCGVHLTAISEWPDYRWGPVSPRAQVPTLLDEAGYFYKCERMPEFLAHVQLDQLEMEFRAQIAAVLAAGLQPTHLDWHCLRLGERPDIVSLMFRLAREFGLALRVIGQAFIETLQGQGLPTNDAHFLDSYGFDPVEKPARFGQLLRALPAGLTEWAVHPGLNTPELVAIEREGHQERQSDYDFLMSPAAQAIVREEGIRLIDYRALQAVWKAQA